MKTETKDTRKTHARSRNDFSKTKCGRVVAPRVLAVQLRTPLAIDPLHPSCTRCRELQDAGR